MKNFQVTRVLLIIVIFLGGLYFLSPAYLRNSLIYMYPNIDDYRIFDNRTVIAGAHQPWKEEPGSANRELAPGYEAVLEKYQTVAYLVVKDDRIIFERYWDGFSPDDRLLTFSMTKSIIGLLTGIAIDKGFIDSVDQPVANFIPSFSKDGLKGITIRHLLEMSSGLSWDDSYWNPFSVTAKAYYGDNLRELVLEQKPVEEPGKIFRYKNINTQLLAMVIEQATGMSVSAFASQNLWKPLGASQDAWWSLDKVDGIEKAFAGFNTNARDMARFGRLILNEGSWNGRQLISKEYLTNALTPAAHLSDKYGLQVNYYGWHWWIHEQQGKTVYSMRGLKGQYMIVVPEEDLIIVRFGKKASQEMIDKVIHADFQEWVEIGLYLSGIKPG